MTDPNIDILFQQAHQLLNQTKKADLDEVQISIQKELEIGTRFGENHITQNSFTDITELNLVLVKNQKIGKIVVNLPKPDQFQSVIDDGLTILKFSEPDKDFPGFIEKSSNNPLFQESHKKHTVEDVADNVQKIIRTAHDYDSSVKTVAGNINTFNNYSVFMNSHGVELWQDISRVSTVINVSANANTSDYESRSSVKLAGKTLNDLQLDKNSQIVAERAKRGLNPSSIDIGSYITIFSPAAANALTRFISMGSSAESLVNHRSFMKDKIGEQVFDKKLTITDERNNPNHFLSSSFDSDGTQTQSIRFIENGVLKDYAYNRRLAKKLLDNTEHSNGTNFSGFGGEMPMFISNTISSGNKTEEELISSVDHGIYIVDLFYNNFVNAPEGLCTGLTKDGLYKIEKGEIVGSLKNMRWTDKIESIFNSIDVANNSIQIGGFFVGSTITPSIKTDKFTFTSAGKH